MAYGIPIHCGGLFYTPHRLYLEPFVLQSKHHTYPILCLPLPILIVIPHLICVRITIKEVTMPRISRRSPPQAAASQLARSIKTAAEQSENRDIIGTSRELTVEQRLPEVRKAQKVTLKGTTKLEAAYVQIHGPKPQEPCQECQRGSGPFKECVFANTGDEKEIMGRLRELLL